MPATASRPQRRWIIALALGLAPAAVTAVPSAALADPPAETADAEVTSYRFDDELVRGGVPAPTAEHLYVRRRSDRESLIRVRTQFVHELLKSAEQL
jgi:hypothetical protein